MAFVEYQGFDSAGKKVRGSIEGSGQRTVIASLRQQGVFVSEISLTGAARPQNWWQKINTARVPVEDLAVATRQLSTLLGAGLSLELSISTVASQLEQPQLAKALNRVRDAVVEGEPMHLALAADARIFPPVYLSMIEVGENSGTLDQALNNLADLLEEQARLRSRITAALAYPLLMALVGTGVLLFLVGFVLPKVTSMLTELDQVLPLATRMLIAVSNLLRDYGWLLLLLFVAALVFFQRWAARDRGRETLDRWKLKLPILGKLSLLIATSRFSRTLSTLLGSGLPLLRALEITAKLLNNRVLQQVIESAQQQIREGSSLAGPLHKAAIFPVMLTQMIAIGEKSGELEPMLRRVADTCDQQIELSINRMLSLLEPIMILFMGTAVGFIVLAILLPIFQASQSLG